MSAEDLRATPAAEEQPRRQFFTTASGLAMTGGLLTAYGTLGIMMGRFVYPAAAQNRGWLFVCTVDSLAPVLDCQQVIALQEAVRQVSVDDSIHNYLLDLIEATRECDELHVGASTRGALCLYRASQGLALVEGRDYVVPDDIKRLAVPVLAHRVITKGYLHGNQRGAVEGLIQRLVDELPTPG